MKTDVSRTSTHDRSSAGRIVLRVSAVHGAVLLVAALALSDLEAAALTGASVVGIALLRFRTGLLGELAALGLGINSAAWMAPAAVSNITHDDGFFETALAAVLTVVALSMVVAAVAALVGRRRTRPASIEPRTATWVGAALVGAALIVSALPLGSRDAGTADASVVMRDTKFSEDTIEVAAGEVTIAAANEDLFWHTFTVSDLSVNLRVPVGGDRAITFAARPGSYAFVCAIPGHTQAGMEGTLIVR